MQREPFNPDRIKASTTGEPDQRVDALAHKVIGAAIEVHRELGPGYLESVYESAMAIELRRRDIPFVSQWTVPVLYKGESIGSGKLDMLVADALVVEFKAVEQLMPIHTAQVVSYLRATRKTLGLLINFNVPTLKNGIKRVVLT